MIFNNKPVIYGHMSSVVALLGPWESVTPQASMISPGLATTQGKQTEWRHDFALWSRVLFTSLVDLLSINLFCSHILEPAATVFHGTLFGFSQTKQSFLEICELQVKGGSGSEQLIELVQTHTGR